MDNETYQKAAHGFATYGDNPMYPALGLAEEAGEACGKIAKFIRKHNGIPPISSKDAINDMIERKELDYTFSEEMEELKCNLSKELGDVLWMVSELCTTFSISIGDVMDDNIAKLEDRKSRNVIVGEGDNR